MKQAQHALYGKVSVEALRLSFLFLPVGTIKGEKNKVDPNAAVIGYALDLGFDLINYEWCLENWIQIDYDTMYCVNSYELVELNIGNYTELHMHN